MLNHSDYLVKQGKRDFNDDLHILMDLGGLNIKYNPNILDIGCNDGSLSLNLLDSLAFFQGLGKNDTQYRYTGVEYKRDVVEKAKQKHLEGDHIFICGDIYDTKVFEAVEKNGPFDLIILSQVLQHVSNPQKLLSLIRPLLSDKGVLCIKVVEDGLKTCHPAEDTLQEILSLYQTYVTENSTNIEGAHTDRYCGHKTYGYLVNAGYTNIKHEIIYTNTVGKSLDERMEEFEMFASFRLRDNMPEDYMNRMSILLNDFKARFTNEDFYFATPTMYFVAKK